MYRSWGILGAHCINEILQLEMKFLDIGPGSLPFEYLVFFLVGTVPRAWRFGRYARPPGKGKPGTRPQDFVLPGR